MPHKSDRPACQAENSPHHGHGICIYHSWPAKRRLPLNCSDSKCNGDIPFDRATWIGSGATAAMPVNVRAMLGNNTEAYSYADMIDTD